MGFRTNVALKEVFEESVEEGNSESFALHAVPSTGGLSKQELDQLILDHRENGRKLARSMLRRWRVRMPAEETDSIVDLTLCEAARRFSPNKGASFMTFFFYHLRGNLVRSVAGAAKANNFIVSFAKTAGVEVGDLTSISDQIPALFNEYSIFENRENDVPESKLLRREKIEQCQDAISQLDDLEQEIVYRLYGDEDALIEIARNLGYSRCHISRVKKRALQRLKTLLLKAGVVEEKKKFSKKPRSGRSRKAAASTVAESTPLRRSRRRRALLVLSDHRKKVAIRKVKNS